MSAYLKEPTTKAEFINRLLQRDFSGDLATLAKDGRIHIERQAGNSILVTFEGSGTKFLLSVHKPKSFEARMALKAAYIERQQSRASASGSDSLPGPPLGEYQDGEQKARRRPHKAA